jgi:glycosyltransferase involved in cell wall biosynthesis
VVLAHLKARRPWGGPVRGDFEGTPSWTLPPRAWVSGLRRIARETPFDLVHAQHYGGATRSYFACRRYGWPMVYEIHSLLGDEVDRDRLGRGLAFRFYTTVERRVCRDAAAVIVLGAPVQRVVVEEKGVPAERVAIIYPGIDLGEYDRPGAPAAIAGIGPEHKVIMYVGSLVHPNQGVPILIDALPHVFGAVPEARCVLVGGPAEAGARYRAQLGPLGDRLLVLTGQTPEQVVALTRRADVLVHPRLACRENYSVQSKIAVYLAAARPIVATDFGDYPTILGNTGAGLLTAVAPEPLARGIVAVLTHPDRAARLAAACRPVAEELFGMDRNIDRYLDVYDRALAVGVPA